MATERVLNPLTLTAGADLSTKQFYCVKFSSGKVILPTADTDQIIGVLQNKPSASGQAASVAVADGDVTKVVASGAETNIAVGDMLGSDDDGTVIKVTADHSWVLGFALDASTADGDVIRCLITKTFISA